MKARLPHSTTSDTTSRRSGSPTSISSADIATPTQA
jgi:hypothetical protein